MNNGISDADTKAYLNEFNILISILSLSDCLHLVYLFELYELGQIPIEEHYKGRLLEVFINQINTYSPGKAKIFLVFFKGFMAGLEKKEAQFSQDVYFVVGQNTINNRIESQTNTIDTGTAINIDAAAIGELIKRGLITKEDMQLLFDSLSVNFDKIDHKPNKKPSNNN